MCDEEGGKQVLGELGSAGLVAGLGDLGGLFQSQWLCAAAVSWWHTTVCAAGCSARKSWQQGAFWGMFQPTVADTRNACLDGKNNDRQVYLLQGPARESNSQFCAWKVWSPLFLCSPILFLFLLLYNLSRAFPRSSLGTVSVWIGHSVSGDFAGCSFQKHLLLAWSCPHWYLGEFYHWLPSKKESGCLNSACCPLLWNHHCLYGYADLLIKTFLAPFWRSSLEQHSVFCIKLSNFLLPSLC